MFERISRDDKMLLAFATQEAADLGHRQLGNDHLILGMLCNARSPLFTILADQGLNLASAREVVRKYHDEHADQAEATDTNDESARRRYEEDREALRSIGIDLDKVREAVRGRFGEDLSDGWGERPGRGAGRRGGPDGGRGRGRGHGRRHGHGHGPHRARGPRPDCGPEGFGPEGPGGFGPGGFGPGGYGPGPFGPGGPFAGDEGPWEPGRGRRGPRGRGNRPRFASDTRSVFARAVEIARERGDRHLRGEYLLLGIIDTADDASRTLIESATTADELKAAVWASLPEVDAEV
ncbi:Clp protease N-terminal domain-containing protein [Gordonia westfalica]|uniref:Clp amino terminal domain-containing protein, pathogenicity island component n=1 Tax=Gordonia westfalica TaxID=158898 RepID=A0A1H2JYP3_9ACTN|nr:Clp protease N-terminal domain-containing protein [Gordonia westfalica]SDU61413.1 Clp amino terminal domain-containing protein, pathogenicity island component [Gordonia westfalica]